MPRVDAAAAEMRRLWRGGAAPDGQAVGPAPVQPGGPCVLCASMGPKSLARAATWADGVSGFAITGDVTEAARAFRLAERAWLDAGRSAPPRLVTGVFVALGPYAAATLRGFAMDYLAVFGTDMARLLAEAMTVHNEQRLRVVIDELAAEGCDELILVPADSNPSLLDRITEVVG